MNRAVTRLIPETFTTMRWGGYAMRRLVSILAIVALAALTLGGATAIAADQARTRSQARDQSADCTIGDFDGDRAQTRAQEQVQAGAQEQVQAGAQAGTQARTQAGSQVCEPVQTQTRSQEQSRLQDGTCDGDQAQAQTRNQDCTQLQEGATGDCDGTQAQERNQDQLRDGSWDEGQQSQTRTGSGRRGA